MALVLREAELNRREAALRRAAEAGAEDEGHTQVFPELEQALEARLLEVEQRERELQAMIEAVAAQRELHRVRPQRVPAAPGRPGRAHTRGRGGAEPAARRAGTARLREPRARRRRQAGRTEDSAGRACACGHGAGDRACTKASGVQGTAGAARPRDAGDADGRAAHGRRVVVQAARNTARSRVARRIGLYTSGVRGVSSAGRAPPLQGGGHRFDPDTLHMHRNPARRGFLRRLSHRHAEEMPVSPSRPSACLPLDSPPAESLPLRRPGARENSRSANRPTRLDEALVTRRAWAMWPFQPSRSGAFRDRRR